MTRQRRILMTAAGVAAFTVGFFSSLGSAPAQERFDYKVREDFFSGFGGNRERLERGMKACEAALAVNPKNAEALVWHGSGLYFHGGQAFQAGDNEKGMNLVQRGMGEMAKAVELEPNNVGVRIPRGAILLQSSLFMPEGEFTNSVIRLGLDDYLTTLKVQESRFESLGVHPRGELLQGIAGAYSRTGNQEQAEKFYRRIASELKGTEYEKRANKWLETKTLAVNESTCYGCHVAGAKAGQ